MNELIKVDFTGEKPAVSARDLHEFLEVGADYRHWFPRMCEYGFAEGEDFNPVKIDRVQQEGNRMVSRMVEDAALSIDMAKEICMIQRNEKGKLARQYFLALEKDWNSPEKVMARALQIAEKELKQVKALNSALKVENNDLIAENERQRQVIADFEPIKRYMDTILESPGVMATSQIAADYDMSGRRLNKILHEEGVQRCVNGQWLLYRKHMGQGYTKSKTFTFDRSDGIQDSRTQTYWTQKGRIMIHEILTKRGITAVMDRGQA